MGAPADAAENYDVVETFVRTFDAGDVICRPGEPSAHLYVLRDGIVDLVDRAGTSRTVQVGDTFGELPFFEGRPGEVTARARSAVSVFQLNQAALERITGERPEIAVAMLHRLARRLQPAGNAPVAGVAPVRPAPPPAEPPPPPSPRAPAGDARLIHEDSGTAFVLAGLTEASVGRQDRVSGFHPFVDLTPFDGDRTLSRRHALLVRRGDGWIIREESGVRNGTFVNGTRVPAGADVELHDGDQIQFGLVKTVFHRA